MSDMSLLHKITTRETHKIRLIELSKKTDLIFQGLFSRIMIRTRKVMKHVEASMTVP